MSQKRPPTIPTGLPHARGEWARCVDVSDLAASLRIRDFIVASIIGRKLVFDATRFSLWPDQPEELIAGITEGDAPAHFNGSIATRVP